MTKRMVPFIIFICFSNFAYGQQKQQIHYLKNNNKEVSVKDSADFIRIIRDPDSAGHYFSVIELYPDDKVKCLALTSSSKNLHYEGQFISYYANGKNERRSSYRNNKLTGLSYEFYPNGKIKLIKDYGAEEDKDFILLGYKLMYSADSNGTEAIKEGNGHFVHKYLDDNTDEVVEEGDYKNGLKAGTWSGKYLNKNCSYQEKFNNGIFISGQSLINSVTYNYNQIEEPVDCAEGMNILYSRMIKTLEYPKDALDANITGKVFLSYVVETNGTAGSVKIERKIFPSLDREAKRILNFAIRTKWNPRRTHGIPIRTAMYIPVSFTLN